MTRGLRIAFATSALLAQACASGQWAKDGADAATVSRDLDACRAAALGRGVPPISPARSTEAVTDVRPGVGAPTATSNERFVAEQEEIQRCMQKRGYRLKR